MTRITMRRRVRAAAAVAATMLMAGCAAPGAASDRPAASPDGTADASAPAHAEAERRLAELEGEHGVRIGVVAAPVGADADGGDAFEYRAEERFPHASTIKAIVAGLVLDETDDAQLDELVRYGREDLVTYSPVTEPAVDTGLTVRQLLDASVRFSDNTAANLLVERLGGLEAVGDLLRAAGDDVTRVSRLEPDMNEAVPGDERDTTTPRAIAAVLGGFTMGDALDDGDREHLVDLLVRNTTGDALIRSVAPDGWTVGDKTGSASYGTRNDIAVLWPGEGAGEPIVLTVFTTSDDPERESDDALVAAAAQIALDAITTPSGRTSP